MTMESDGMTMPKWAEAGLAANNIAVATKTERIEVTLRIIHASFSFYKLYFNFS
jgi:hypothetical protein